MMRNVRASVWIPWAPPLCKTMARNLSTSISERSTSIMDVLLIGGLALGGLLMGIVSRPPTPCSAAPDMTGFLVADAMREPVLEPFCEPLPTFCMLGTCLGVYPRSAGAAGIMVPVRSYRSVSAGPPTPGRPPATVFDALPRTAEPAARMADRAGGNEPGTSTASQNSRMSMLPLPSLSSALKTSPAPASGKCKLCKAPMNCWCVIR
mmetsp:Transcript_70827/g.122671  ORF Transcript_70827/g.122671 Transcript_70827/m.122671 type:complete len:207 (-) Transcript_70827:250-870(-)